MATSQDKQDLYPTRTQSPRCTFNRRDPVLWNPRGNEAPGPMSGKELARFERDGFIYYPSFFQGDELSRLTSELSAVMRDPVAKNAEGTIREPGSEEIRSVFQIEQMSRVFERLANDARITDRVSQMLDSDVYLHQSRINYKPGFRGKPFDWHSDFETWHAEDGMPRMRAISCSIILTDNTEFNGPLMLIPGSHRTFIPCLGRTPDDNYKQSLRKQRFGVPDEQSIAELVDRGGLRAPTGPAGSVLFFECNTLHGSGGNMSPYPRSNAFFVYNSVDNQLQQPFAANRPRPRFLAARSGHTAKAA